MKTYTYSDTIWKELTRVIRHGLIPSGMHLRRASLTEDFGGVDATAIINQHLRLQIRCRFNRPVFSPEIDVTFRAPSEWQMMAARTYAPAALFAWFKEEEMVAGHVVDIYRMAAEVRPALREREPTPNRDGSAFITVEIPELHKARSLLRHWDGQVWSTPLLGGARRWLDLLQQDQGPEQGAL